MSMSELKPCPFCSGKNLHIESFSGWGNDVIICYDCLSIFSQMEITCEDDLVDAWNKRADKEKSNDSVPETGSWLPHYSEEDGERDGTQCSQCNERWYFGGAKPNFCPNCGARMQN